MTLLDAALQFHAAGLAVLPVKPDGSKAPAVNWKHHQNTPPDVEQLTRWFTGNHFDGLGLITGSVSGQLEMFEVEGRAVHLVEPLGQLMGDHGYTDLWVRLCAGYLEQTPSGGMHWHYRVHGGDAYPNTKLARRPATDAELAENPKDKIKVMVETRGQGGFTVTAPSHGRSHPTSIPWKVLRGTPADIPTITVDERDALHAIARMLDQMPVVDAPPRPLTVVGGSTAAAGDRPGDDYNAKATWDDILEGWTRAKRMGPGFGWTRPGKHPRDGISATTGTGGDGVDRLYVFSSSTEFDTETPYTKFAAYAVLHHRGDYAEAARQLRKDGYGAPPAEQQRPAEVLTIDGPPIQPPPRSGQATAPLAEVIELPKPSTYSLTDDGNALRLVDNHHPTIRYCPEAGSWLRWGGNRWIWDTAGTVHELARGIARHLPATSGTEGQHRRKSLSNTGLKAMVNVARTDTRVIVTPDQLDARPYELNTPAGVVDLRTGQLGDPDPAALNTRITTVAPDFTAPAPRWQRFLADTFAGDPAMTTYVQRLLGLTLIGEHLEQILPFQWGSGANGKSTLMDVIQGIVGIGESGYSIPAPSELLLATTQHGHPTELARLSGARMVVASELEDGERFAESRIKMLTGGDTIAARFMGKDFFSFTPTHTIWLHANEKPAVRAGGPALWRRLRLLPFVHVVPPEDRIQGLDRILVAEEGPAILAWAITGTVQYLTEGLAEPDAVKVATNAYERDQDTVARFIEECCQRGPVASQIMRVRVAELRQSYETWCRVEGETPISAKALTTALTQRFGVVSERSMSARFYGGIRLVDQPTEEPEPGMTDLSLEPPDQPEPGSDAWWNR